MRPFGPVAGQPLARGSVADPGRLGGRDQRPPRFLHAIDQQLAALQTEPGVSVQLHPVSSLGLTGLSTCQPPRSTAWLTSQTGTTSSGTTPRGHVEAPSPQQHAVLNAL